MWDLDWKEGTPPQPLTSFSATESASRLVCFSFSHPRLITSSSFENPALSESSRCPSLCSSGPAQTGGEPATRSSLAGEASTATSSWSERRRRRRWSPRRRPSRRGRDPETFCGHGGLGGCEGLWDAEGGLGLGGLGGLFVFFPCKNSRKKCRLGVWLGVCSFFRQRKAGPFVKSQRCLLDIKLPTLKRCPPKRAPKNIMAIARVGFGRIFQHVPVNYSSSFWPPPAKQKQEDRNKH